MNKIFYTLLFLLCISLSSFAQTAIPNGSFETWTNAGSSTAQPTTWSSNKTGTGYATLGPQTCFQNTAAYSGNYSAKIESESYIGQVVNGSLTTGQVNAPSTNKSDGYISSVPGNTGHIATFTGRPDSLIFWYQYTSVSSDYPTVEARLHVDTAYAPETTNSYHPTTTYNIIARALWQGPASSSTGGWNRVALPFVYVDGRTPQYILISCTSSGNQTGGSSGSILLLDDMIAYYIPQLATSTSVATGPYYVTATASTPISVPFTLTGTVDSNNVVTAQLSDANGSFASPVNIGTLTTMSSGTISAIIPAGTATGTGYRVRVSSSGPVINANDNGSNITIDLVSNSIAPATTQNIAANTNGTLLTVTETVAATSRQWEYSTTSGGPYAAFTTAQTGTTYAPNFATAGTYYVVCVSSYPGPLNITSNQVQVNVVSNSIAPTASQSLLTGVNGNVLTVTETPTGTSRQWASSPTSGGPYTNISGQTGTAYVPNFATAGTYYVVCQSTIDGIVATSNEVEISVGSATITTQPVSGSPFLFSPSAPAASVSVAYVTSGTFNGINIFTAQLSDATGSFATPTFIGTLTSTTNGTISASIPSNTPAGTAYRIRVVSSSPVILGSDNGTNLIVDQFNNSIAPTTTQTIPYSTNGTALTVTPSQPGNQSWKYSTTSGSGYVPFVPAQTGLTYTPNFALPGTYYVVCVSYNQYNDSVTSNQVEIIVQNGTTLTTLDVSGSPFLVSDSANVQVNINYASDVVFNAGDTLWAQLSDNIGGFTNPVVIGTLASTSSNGTIAAVIPNTTAAGTQYLIRVVSSNPAIIGTPDSNSLTVIPFAVSVAPADTQVLIRNQNGNTLTASSSQPSTYNWEYTEISGSNYTAFNPVQTDSTYTPNFPNVNTYYVVCNVTNAVNASLLTPEVVVIVNVTNAITGIPESTIKAYWDNSNFVVDLTGAKLNTPVIQLVDVTGQVVLKAPLANLSVNRFATQLPQGVYVFRIIDGNQNYTGKTNKK